MNHNSDQMRTIEMLKAVVTQSELNARSQWLLYGLTGLVSVAVLYGLTLLNLSLRNPVLTQGIHVSLLISSSVVCAMCLLFAAPLGRYKASLPTWIIVPGLVTYLMWQTATLYRSGQLDGRADFMMSSALVASVSGGLAWLISLGILKLIPEPAIKKKADKLAGPYDL